MGFVTTALDHIYHAAQRRYPEILFHGDRSHRAIALTFDDGPHPRDTPRVLDVLGKYEVRGTFFLVGKSVERYRNIVKQTHQQEHQLALHCFRHLPFPLETSSSLYTQLEQTKNLIAKVCEISPQTIRDLRPPYGVFNRRTRSQLTERGFRLVMWSCIPPHWMQPASWSIRQVMEAIFPGAVIVLHDGHGHGKRVAEILEGIIPRIQSLGYDFLTVEEMQDQRKQLRAYP
jgi:peptidoglycan/xylan/chitin deacetylase (PgdA/CDA1 family)